MPQHHSKTERRVSDGTPTARCLQGRLGLPMGNVAVRAQPARSVVSLAPWTPLHQL